jgi:hypothetical protein
VDLKMGDSGGGFKNGGQRVELKDGGLNKPDKSVAKSLKTGKFDKYI